MLISQRLILVCTNILPYFYYYILNELCCFQHYIFFVKRDFRITWLQNIEWFANIFLSWGWRQFNTHTIFLQACYPNNPTIQQSTPLPRYFYTWGYIYPDSASVFIALDECTKETGCLQVIKGSHHLGRINHFVAGKMLQADPEIVTEVSRLEESWLKAEEKLKKKIGITIHSLMNKRNWARVYKPKKESSVDQTKF